MPDPQQAPEVVIVDEGGTEHHFPAGFDPVKAAGIVRESTKTPKQRDMEDPTYRQIMHLAGGTVEGLAHAPITAIKGVAGTVHDIATGARDIWNGEVPKDAGNHLFDAAQNIYHLPQQFMDATSEDQGKMIGELGGGMALAKMAPMAPRPIARVAGSAIEGTGKIMRWPARIAGAHSLISGNPFGAALIAAPPYVENAGLALKHWGGAEPAFMENEIAQFKGAAPPVVDARPPIRIVGQSNPLADVALANPRPVESFSQGELTAQKAAQKAAEDAARARAIEAAKAGLEPSVPSIRESLSAPTPQGGRQSMSRSFREPEPTYGGAPNAPMPPQAPPTRPIPGKVILPDPETAAPGYVPGGAVRPPIRIVGPEAGPVAPIAPSAPVGPPEPPVAPSPVNPVKMSQEAAAKAFNDAMAAKQTTSPAIDQLLSERAAKVPLADAGVASKSRGAMSVTPGLTIADAQALGINPSIKITGLTPDSIRKLLEDRANRAASHRINAGMDAGANRAMSLDDKSMNPEMDPALWHFLQR